MSNNMNRNRFLQKGNRVEWFDGNKKGTGTIVKPVHIVKNINVLGTNGLVKDISGCPDEFVVKDDATGEKMTFGISQVRKIQKDKKK